MRVNGPCGVGEATPQMRDSTGDESRQFFVAIETIISKVSSELFYFAQSGMHLRRQHTKRLSFGPLN